MLHIIQYLSGNKEATLVSLLVNIFSSVVLTKCAGWKEKILIRQQRRRLEKWVKEYLKQHDATILCCGEYINYLEKNRIFEEFYRYVMEPEGNRSDEESFIGEQVERCRLWMDKQQCRLTVLDYGVLKEFYEKLLSELKGIWQLFEGGGVRQLLYHAVQVECGQDEAIEILKKNYTLTDHAVRKLEEYAQSVREELQNNRLVLDDQWFWEQNQVSIDNLGTRYLPELNVDLDIQEYFDILAGSEFFFDKVRTLFQRLILVTTNTNDWDFNFQKEVSEQQYYELREKTAETIAAITDFVRYNEARGLLDDFLTFCMNQGSYEYRMRLNRRKQGQDVLLPEIDRFYQIVKVCHEIVDYLDETAKDMLQYPYVVLYGRGGVGKSHLLADTVVKRKQRKENSILLLGEDFAEDAIIHIRISQLLDLPYSFNQILDEINRLAQEKHSRILLMIDALNEGGGRKLWEPHFPGFVRMISQYPWVGLAVSVRTDFLPDIVSDSVIDKFHITLIEHAGLGRMTDEAVRKYFKAYKIDMQMMPYIPEEFHNPLFLKMFCEGYSENREKPVKITTIQIYGNYICAINRKLSKVYEYSSAIAVLDEILDKFVLESYRSGQRNKLCKQDAVRLVAEIVGKYHIKTTIYDSLISEGILTDESGPDGEEYVRITYERLADHIYAKIWVDSIVQHTMVNTEIIGKINKPGVIYELTILLAEKGIELFECFPELRNESRLIDAFSEGIAWRDDSSLRSEGTKKYVKAILDDADRSVNKACRVLNGLIRIAARPEHPYNAAYIHSYLMQLTMPERDGWYMSLFRQWCQTDGAVRRMIDWLEQNIFIPAPAVELEDDDRYLMAVILLWMCVTTDTKLYNELGAVLCTLLRGHTRVMIRLIESFHTVDDTYVLSMLYAVGLGVIVYEESEDMIRQLGEFVYAVFFCQDEVIADIMVRDYAYNIVLYAARHSASEIISLEKARGPFCSVLPEIPGDDEMENYKNRAKDDTGMRSIWSSMQVEQAGSWYGDFGRYVFQRYFNEWKEVSAYDLMKIAIKDILENRYRPKLHGVYDGQLPNPYRIADWKVERIGKKYQWQALYRLAAQVSDNFLRFNEGTEEEEYYSGNYEHNLRKFDPTVNYYPYPTDVGELPPVNNPCFELEYKDWIHTVHNLPSIDNLITLTVEQSEYWMLDGYIRIEEEILNEFQNEKEEYPHKEIWFMVHAYMVKDEDYETCSKLLGHENFWGRWMPEGHENYAMYNREYYWSDTHEYYDNEYYGGSEWKYVWRGDIPELEEIDFLVLADTYVATGERELHNLPYTRWSKPCQSLYKQLRLQYREANTVLYDQTGHIACFDTVELFGKEQGFYMDKRLLEQFMEQNHYRMFWTILGEKRWMDYSYGGSDDRFPWQDYSGFAAVEKGRPRGEIWESENC